MAVHEFSQLLELCQALGGDIVQMLSNAALDGMTEDMDRMTVKKFEIADAAT